MKYSGDSCQFTISNFNMSDKEKNYYRIAVIALVLGVIIWMIDLVVKLWLK